MNRGVIRRLCVGVKAHVGDEAVELLVNVLPFAHAHEGEEVLLAPLPQLARGKVLLLLLVLVPQVEKRAEIGVLIAESGVRLVRGVLGRHRPLARILHGQCRGDDHDLVEAPFLVGLENHAPHAWVDGQLGEV
jgi:hypothetical protein